MAVVRPQVVCARRIRNECQIIRCETKEELGAVAMLFGKSCLVGLRDAPPKVRSSRFINNNCPCNVIEPNAVKEIPFKVNTSRLGIDFEHNGTTLRVVVRFRQVFGRDGIVRSLHGVENGTTTSNGRAHRINASIADIRRVSINSFFQLARDLVLLSLYLFFFQFNSSLCIFQFLLESFRIFRHLLE